MRYRIVIDGRYVIDLDRPTERIGVIDLICPRRAWRVFRMPVRVLIEETGDLMVHGKIVHDVVLSQLKERGCEVEVPVEVEACGQRRRFRADAVCGDLVVELKRKYSRAVWPMYVWQLKVYMVLLGRRRGAIVTLMDGYTAYMEVDDGEAEFIRRRFMESLNKAVCSEREPERYVGAWCKYCGFSRECLSGRLA